MTRLRRRAARAVWWRLPAPARDRLRPLLFRAIRLRAGFPASLFQPSRRWEGATLAEPPRLRTASLRRVDERVSVVIPTLNAGPLFARVLASVRQQSTEVAEVIVVDSGSTDDTPALAESYGARLLRTAPEAFGHGRTRNLGAEAAAGDVLLMLVQDAVLLGRETLQTLLLELCETGTVAAVSARHLPRSDADLYGAFVVFAHRELQRGGSGLASADRRASAGVDNVCAAIRRSAWEALRFEELPFAEDLDFGLRAVEHGWSVRLSRGAAVAHSHNRGVEYQFKRHVADRLHVAALVGDEGSVRASEHSPADILAAAPRLAEEVQGAVDTLPAEAALPDHLRALRSALAAGRRGLPPRGELARLAELSGNAAGDGSRTTKLLRDDLQTVLGWSVLAAFARAQPGVSREDAGTFVAKVAASVLGRATGDALRRAGAGVAAGHVLAGI